MSELTSLVDIYDSDIPRIGKVLAWARSKQQRMVDLESFRLEVIDKFAGVGFRVDVILHSTNFDDVWYFDFEIQERLTEFDPDRMVWEVTNDILDLGTKGVIKSEGGSILSKKSNLPSSGSDPGVD